MVLKKSIIYVYGNWKSMEIFGVVEKNDNNFRNIDLHKIHTYTYIYKNSLLTNSLIYIYYHEDNNHIICD